uniref:Facilitated trehalose transporter Tret1 n=2 Tax=Lygus hesperus TaxID=30085 RepID=A0A146L3L7_LYGHE
MNEEKRKLSGAHRIQVRPMSAGSGMRERTIKSGQGKQYMASVIVCILAFAFGTVVGWTSPVLEILQSDDSPVGRMTLDETSWLGSLTFIGGIVGSFLWGRIADAFGRKVAGYCVSVPFILGWTAILVGTTPKFLYAARLLTGLSGSGALIICPLYISEVAHDSIRGTLGSYVILFMNGGVVAAYSVGAALDYRSFTGFCLAIPIVFIACYFWLPETPNYYMSKSRNEAAETSLLWFRGGDHKVVSDETENIAKGMSKKESATYSDLVSTKGNRIAMVIGLGLFSWQQFCGILALLTFVSDIFQKAGSSMSSSKATIMVGMFQFSASYVSSVIVERSGRKLLLLISYFVMGTSLFVLAGYIYIKPEGLGWIPVACLCLHVVAYALGAGPIPYIVMTETLRPDIKGLATSTIIFWGTLLAFISVQVFPILNTHMGQHGAFLFFGAWCYIGFVFTWFIVPETKGISLNDILAKLNGDPTNLMKVSCSCEKIEHTEHV